MGLYIRAYADYSYEIIFTKGIFRKKRLHILINPGKEIKLSGNSDNDVHVNTRSLTHIVAMETSTKDKQMLEHTINIAELTNKPIITNEHSSKIFREYGLSVKQLRIIGFQDEVVDGLNVDPLYIPKVEKPDNNKDESKSSSSNLSAIGDFVSNNLNPLKWKPVKKITSKILNQPPTIEVDPTKPMAFNLHLGKSSKLLLPLDSESIKSINELIPVIQPNVVIIPNKDVSFSKEIEEGAQKVIILNDEFDDDSVLVMPKTHNLGIFHDTLYGGLEEWIEIK